MGKRGKLESFCAETLVGKGKSRTWFEFFSKMMNLRRGIETQMGKSGEDAKLV